MSAEDRTPPAQDGLPMPQRARAIAVIALALIASVIDSTIANVALPTMARELHVSNSAAVWVVNGYQLAVTVSLLPFSSLGDRIGYRRVFMFSLPVFIVGLIASTFATSLPTLVAARVVCGLGSAGLMSVNSALVRFTYPQHLLGRGIGFNALIISVFMALGPTIGSAVLAAASWKFLFAVNIPVCLLTLALTPGALPANRGSSSRFDIVAAGLNALAFGGLLLGASTVAHGEGGLTGFVQLAVGLAAGGLLVARELDKPAPLLPFDLLRIPMFRLSVITSLASFAAQMLALVSIPFFFQNNLGLTPVQTGLLMSPWPAAAGAVAPLAGWLSDRYPAGVLGGVGLALFALGLLSLAMLPADPSTLDIVWRMALCGAGFGFFQSPNNRAMVTSAPRERAGATGGMLGTARLVGQTCGSIAVAVLFHVSDARATQLSLLTACGVAGLGAAVSLMRVRHHAQPAGASA